MAPRHSLFAFATKWLHKISQHINYLYPFSAPTFSQSPRIIPNAPFPAFPQRPTYHPKPRLSPPEPQYVTRNFHLRPKPRKHRPTRRHHLRTRPRSLLHTRKSPHLPPKLRPRHQQPRRVPLHQRPLPQRLPLPPLDHAPVRRLRLRRRHQRTIQIPPRSRQNINKSKHRLIDRLRPPHPHGTRLRRHALNWRGRQVRRRDRHH